MSKISFRFPFKVFAVENASLVLALIFVTFLVCNFEVPGLIPKERLKKILREFSSYWNFLNNII